MPLTPMDIQQKTFGPELRGYNMDEVDDFLDEVVATLKDYDQRIRDAQDRIRALETELAARGEQESVISRVLLAAQRQADALLDEAREEAERIRADASTEAHRLRSDREAERMSLTQDIARMRATVADLKRRVVELAASAGDDLDAMDAAIAEVSAGLDESASRPERTPGDWGAVSDDATDREAAGWEAEVTSGQVSEEVSEEVWESPRARSDGSETEIESETGIESETEIEPETEIERADPDEEASDEEASDEEGEGEPEEREPEEGEEEELEEEEGAPLGALADEMARQAGHTDEHYGDATPPGRRPWERGSV